METKRQGWRSNGIWLAAVGVIAALQLASGPIAARQPTVHVTKRPSVFYLIPGLSDDAFSVTIGQGAQAAAARLGIRLVYQGSPYAFSPAAQIPYLNAAIVQHPDAILITPTDLIAMIEPIRRAVRAGIPVITVDTFIAAPLAVTNVRSDNLQGGRLAADALARAIHFRGAVASIDVRPGISTTDRRQHGFAQQLRRYRQIQDIGTRYDGNSMARATDITAALLAHHPGLAGLFALNGVSGDGVIAALQRTHRRSHVQLVEFDADPLQVQALRQGLVQALVAQDPWAMGNLAVRLADQWTTGHRTGIRKVYYTGEAVLTRSNVDKPTLKRFLYSGG